MPSADHGARKLNNSLNILALQLLAQNTVKSSFESAILRDDSLDYVRFFTKPIQKHLH